MKSFSWKNRLENLATTEQSVFDIFVVGGGITGAGVARDAASRGMKVVLAEQNDFAIGTSSRSSKMIHGGIRYLENKEFGLVFEALSERTKLFSIAPHLVHPLRFMLPIYEGGRVGMGLMSLGMWLYDALSLFRAPELHERLNKSQSLERMPALNGVGLLGSFVYSDAYMDDDRLVIETLRSANAMGAVAMNYLKVNKVEFGKPHIIHCEDVTTKKNYQIKAHHIVSSVGPWTDEFGHQVIQKWKDILRPTKGIHLTFNKSRLNLPSAVVMASGKDNRIVFGIPRHDMIIVGTTDTDFKQHPEEVVATKEDVDYLLAIADQYFPGAKLKKQDILASYAGVRPLVHDGSSSEGKTSREHTIMSLPEGITFVAGGKYTTYRKMAEDILKSVLKFFSLDDRGKFNRGNTTGPLNPMITEESYRWALGQDEQLAQESGMPLADAKLLLSRHGSEAFEIIKKFGIGLSYIEYEALHAIENTMCLNVVDFLARRVPIFLATSDNGESAFQTVLPHFAKYYSWSQAEVKKQQELFVRHKDRELAWKGATNDAADHVL